LKNRILFLNSKGMLKLRGLLRMNFTLSEKGNELLSEIGNGVLKKQS
jgi:hypothetical protein